MTGPKLVPSFLVCLPVLASALFAAPRVQAQTYSTASKRADITVFGMYTNNNPDYGQRRNNGLTLGGDYTRYYRWRVQPSLEVRAGSDNGEIIDQKTVLAGLRLKMDIKQRFHPYGDFLVGGSWIHFLLPPAPNYTHDQGFTRSYGGGVEMDVWRNWGAKIDYQGEHTVYSDQFSPIHLTPSKISGGVVYRIPFRNHLSHGYER